ncbi:MAG: hypothetical protein IJH25_09010, partial [Clostridia bacterium]|nr:hypothetical protein [Clostridia bacterium]
MSQNKGQKKGLSSALRNFFGVGDAGFVLMSTLDTFYFMTFLTNFANFAPAVALVIHVGAEITGMAEGRRGLHRLPAHGGPR